MIFCVAQISFQKGFLKPFSLNECIKRQICWTEDFGLQHREDRWKHSKKNECWSQTDMQQQQQWEGYDSSGKCSHLVLLMSDPHLFFKDGCTSSFFFPHYPFLFQLRTPETLDAVRRGSQLTVFQVELSTQHLILPLHLPELGLHLQQLPPTSPHRLPQQGGGHPLVVMVVQHGDRAQVTVRQQVSMRQPHWSNIGTAAHGCNSAPVHGSVSGPTQSHSASWVGGSGAHTFMVAQVHGPWSGIGSIEGLDVLHGERLSPRTTPAPTVCPSMAKPGGPWQARGPYGAALYMANSSGTAVHVLRFSGAAAKESLGGACPNETAPPRGTTYFISEEVEHIKVRSGEREQHRSGSWLSAMSKMTMLQIHTANKTAQQMQILNLLTPKHLIFSSYKKIICFCFQIDAKLRKFWSRSGLMQMCINRHKGVKLSFQLIKRISQHPRWPFLIYSESQ